MGNLRACLALATAALALAACGNDHATPMDAAAGSDAPAIDAQVFLDAPIDSPPAYDFSCVGQAPPTTATDPVTVAGKTTYVTLGGLQDLPAVTIDSYEVAAPAVAIDTVTSDATTAMFTTGNLDPANTGMPADVFLKASKATYRTTYLYPPYPLAQSVTDFPASLISDQLFGGIASALMVMQDDANNGALVLLVTDCAGTAIDGATVSVQQGGADVGMVKSAPQVPGTFFVFNVPDGATQVSASYMGMTFPTHTITSHKKPNAANAEGTITATQLRPGP